MKFNKKFNLKTTFNVVYIAILLIVIFFYYNLFNFLNTNVIKIIISDSNLAGVPSARLSDDINTSQFDQIIENIKNKQVKTVIPRYEEISDNEEIDI